MKLGVFGGTFDPPHIGHLVLASEALDQLSLDRILWVLTPDPPHKRSQEISPQAQRQELVQAAIADNNRFELSRVDLDRPGPHYSADTLRLLHHSYAGAELNFLIGGDSLHDLPTWRTADLLIKECDRLVVMRRKNDAVDLGELERVLPGLTEKLVFINTPQLEISAREIRARIAAGKSFRYFLLERVYRLIIEKKFYQPS